jgi:hypothetical protein
MNVIEIATSIPTIIDTATATIQSIDKALPAVDTLFQDVDAEAKTAFAAVLVDVKQLAAELKALFEAVQKPAS